MSNSSEKLSFIRRNADTIKPTVKDLEVVKDIEQDKKVSPEQVEEVLEGFETKVMQYERKDASPNSKRILLEASQPANYSIIRPLISLLEEDASCKGITLVTDNISGERFEGEDGKQLHLKPIRNEGKPVFSDISSGPYESALVLDEPVNSPNQTFLYGAKSVYGAKKLYYFSIALYDDMVRRISDRSADNHMDEVDGILTADEFTKDLMCAGLNIPRDRVQVTGSPLIDSVDLEQGALLREKGRGILDIPASATVVFHSSILASAFEKVGGMPDINLQTYERALEGVTAGARANPEKDYVMLLRTHPRMKATEPFPAPPQNMPSNLRIMNGDALTYEENIYAADILLCHVISTETLLASYRGRVAAVFSYPGEGQFGQIIEKLYGEKGREVIAFSNRVNMIESTDSLSALLSNHIQHPPIKKPEGNSLEVIKQVLLSE